MLTFTENTVKFTVYLSIFMQILTGILPLPALFLKTNENDMVVKDVLKLETVVQFVEGIFYILVVYLAISVSSLATYRYFDWVITTPFMLLSTMIFMEWSNHKNKKNKEKTNDNTVVTFMDTVKKYKKLFITIGLLNFVMLLFGFLGETKQMPNIVAVILGFIPFLAMLNFKNIIYILVNDLKYILNKATFATLIFMLFSSYILSYLFSGLGLAYALVLTEIFSFSIHYYFINKK